MLFPLSDKMGEEKVVQSIDILMVRGFHQMSRYGKSNIDSTEVRCRAACGILAVG